MINQHWQRVFPPEYAPHIRWSISCQFMLLGINSSEKKSGFVCAEEVTNPTQPTHNTSVVWGQWFFYTSQGHCSSQIGLAARLPSLHSSLWGVMSSRCKPQPHPPTARKRPGRADDQEYVGLPSVTICAKRWVLSLLTPARFVIIPILLSHSLYCLHIHHSLSGVVYFTVILWHFLHSSFLMPPIPTSLPVASDSQSLYGRPTAPSVRVMCYHHQSQYHSKDIRLSIVLHCPSKGHGNNVSVETKFNEIDCISPHSDL